MALSWRAKSRMGGFMRISSRIWPSRLLHRSPTSHPTQQLPWPPAKGLLTRPLAFMRYKKSPFALKVVGKGKAAKLTLTKPDKFKKALEKIPKGWVKCANEGGKCKFKGIRQVRYGAKDSHGKDHFKIMTKTAGAAGTPCTSVVFGDPIKGT